ncbi:MAG: hypothetical protein KatS3mg050_4130 [Litorilinea sp.]|nr:MAG: hypothetical protein KatS3mg050_4130 [Litorilinea sp.]
MEYFPLNTRKNLVNMAKLRNVLVHMYLEVDLDLLYEYIQERLPELENFVQRIAEYLEQEG